MSETRAAYTVGDPGDEQPPFLRLRHCRKCDRMETADHEHTCRGNNPAGMKPTLAEWEAVGRAYGEALRREDVDAMQEAEEAFWALACRVAGIGGAL